MWNEIEKALHAHGLMILAAAIPAGGVVHELIARRAGDRDPTEILIAIENDPKVLEALRALENEQQQELSSLAMQARAERAREADEVEHGKERQWVPAPDDAPLPPPMQIEDDVVKFARPTLIYLFGVSVIVELLVVLVCLLFAPASLGGLLMVLLVLALPQSILGVASCIYVYRRTTDKQIAVAGGRRMGS